MPKPTAKPLKGLAVTIADRIRTAIVDAEFEFGESLSEDTLAAAFDVSRTPVREALNILQMEGLVMIVPKSGTYVFTPTMDDIAELCDFRICLEQQAVTLTPVEATGSTVVELKRQLAAMDQAITTGDMQLYGRADTAFHLAFFQNCGNRYLQNAYSRILGRVASLRTHLAIRAEGEPERSYRDHADMIMLLANGERASLLVILAAHILRTKDNYLNAFRQLSVKVGTGRTMRLRRRFALTD
ncbi:GntR family transcriptional regulator [Rhizobium sp. BK602]|uniref:GntR family transcriptional regulator n=1 Tax=Rhizobium sp. BK602 TaxID=2586986 RepID=UPI00161FD78C|nr:GntR family transcriptional regulator [Rhizobium sp. BK602]MBB3609542.1 DNA-binding GntR family transcriptional regulator [Rhizobium sp. BK602]